ncbi:MAG: hypothetical protein OEM67_06650, partial [Thermoleophilia bacterium]|nr:hypothetical protein [Thermoleophilia bacterium]
MADLTNIDDATLRDIVRLVDGTLPVERKAALEERVSMEPELQAIVQEQLKGRALATPVDEGEPSRVHATIAARARRGAPRPTFALALGVGAAMVAVLAAILIVLAAPNSTETNIEAVAEVSLRAAEDSVAVDSTAPAVLEGTFDDLQFPNWEEEFGFTASGRRDDTVEGRTVRTTFYDNAAGERRLAYTIVSGGALDSPGDGGSRVVNGVEFEVFDGPLATSVSWERDGRTCVLSGDGSEDMLMAMASWRGG